MCLPREILVVETRDRRCAERLMLQAVCIEISDISCTFSRDPWWTGWPQSLGGPLTVHLSLVLQSVRLLTAKNNTTLRFEAPEITSFLEIHTRSATWFPFQISSQVWGSVKLSKTLVNQNSRVLNVPVSCTTNLFFLTPEHFTCKKSSTGYQNLCSLSSLENK